MGRVVAHQSLVHDLVILSQLRMKLRHGISQFSVTETSAFFHFTRVNTPI